MDKHLEIINATITRLAGNTFAYRGWAITTVAALVAFFAETNPSQIVLALYPVLAFWALDSYSLALERNFRRLFNQVRLGEKTNFDMGIQDVRRPIVDQINAMLSTHCLLFYGAMAVFVVVAAKGNQ